MLSIWQTSFGSRLDFIGKCDINIYRFVFSLLWSMKGIFHFGYEPFFNFSVCLELKSLVCCPMD